MIADTLYHRFAQDLRRFEGNIAPTIFRKFINKTIDAKEHSEDIEELKDVLEEMTQYALEHFETEEAYMTMFNYPEYEYHNEEHYGFIAKTSAYFDRVVNGDYHISK
jgi:hemerythrin-like metal-binding protein